MPVKMSFLYYYFHLYFLSEGRRKVNSCYSYIELKSRISCIGENQLEINKALPLWFCFLIMLNKHMWEESGIKKTPTNTIIVYKLLSWKGTLSTKNAAIPFLK